MKFGPASPADAIGGVTVHTLRQGALVLKKGTVSRYPDQPDLVDIRVLDHFVVAGPLVHSFAEHGQL